MGNEETPIAVNNNEVRNAVELHKRQHTHYFMRKVKIINFCRCQFQK